MTKHEIIEGLLEARNNINALLRKIITEGIINAVGAITGGRKTLHLATFHAEDGADDPTYILVEVDRHSGDQGLELVDSIKLDDKSEGGFFVHTENGYQDAFWMTTSELTDLYLELHFIETVKDTPDWEFTIKDDDIVPKKEE